MQGADATFAPYGADLTPEGAVPVRAVMAEPEAYRDQTVKVEGVIVEVCQMQGCWFTLDVDGRPGPRVLVAREDNGDYAFTVPKDISGRRVVLQGRLYAEALSEEARRHYAEESTSQAPPPDVEWRIDAEGVLVENARG
jgi:hypothetical protein